MLGCSELQVFDPPVARLKLATVRGAGYLKHVAPSRPSGLGKRTHASISKVGYIPKSWYQAPRIP